MKLTFKRGEKGFTLIELMVVVAILAILASIVTGGVLGSKGKGEDTQVKSDAYQVQNAIQRYNNESSEANAWPDATDNQVVEGTSDNTTKYSGVQMYKNDGTALNKADVEYKTVDWDKTTQVRDSDGALQTRKFVPDFLTHKPANVSWVDNTEKVYAWVMLKGTTLNGADSRTVEIFKYTGATDNKYVRIYPEE